MGGIFREIEPPARIVSTEPFDDDWTGGTTEVTSVLTEGDGTTVLTVTMLFPSQAARDAALETGFANGMEAG